MSIIFAKEKDGTINVHAAGYVTRVPKVLEKVVLFGICYGKEKYYDCKAWRNDPAGQVAACLEKPDVISLDGVYERYTNKNGEEQEQIAVDAIFAVTAPAEATRASTTGSGAESQFSEIDEDDSDLPF